VPDISRRNRKGVLSALLLLLASTAFLAGCPFSPVRPVLDAADGKLLEANGDKALERAVREGGRDPFAVLAAFRGSAFLGQSSMLDRSSITLLNEFGNAAILLLRPYEVIPLLKDPSVRRLAWFGPQGRLARLEPSLEFDMLDRFGKGTEAMDVTVLARFRSVPGTPEERQVEEAGFKVLSRIGPNLVLLGPMSRVPRLLGIDWIIYLEKHSAP
jgi:hypothetical protein